MQPCKAAEARQKVGCEVSVTRTCGCCFLHEDSSTATFHGDAWWHVELWVEIRVRLQPPPESIGAIAEVEMGIEGKHRVCEYIVYANMPCKY